MLQVLYVVAAWLIREVVIKFVVIAAVYALLVLLVPIAVGYVAPYFARYRAMSSFLRACAEDM